jgi:hypothetical protein
MAQVAGTQDTYVTKGLREDLQDKIFLINKDDTPFISNVGSDKADAVKTEWQIDVLDPPDLNNAFIEGDTYTYALPTPTQRVGNYCQIMRKTILVSGTLEEVKKAGRASEMKYQAMKKGMALKRDMEGIVTSAQASNAGGAAGAAARRLGGFAAWLTTNVSRGTGGANGGFSAGTGLVSAPTAGTPRAFTETMLKDAQQSAYAAGGDPDMLMLPVPQKRNFSAFPGIAQQRHEVGNGSAATIIAAADVYQGDFGRLSVVPNRQMANGTALGIDPKMAEMAYLRRLFIDKPAKDGDAWKRVMLTEVTLKVLNEAAHFGIFDLS